MVIDSEEDLNELYEKAKQLMHPEAITHLAIMFHDKIIKSLGAESTGKIPASCKLTPCRRDLCNMWDFLALACWIGNDFK